MKIEDFMDNFFLQTLSTLTKEDKFINIMGDFNINLLNYEHCTATCNFFDNLSSSFFQPQILQPTRVTLRSQTLIDNIFTNNTKYESVSGNLTCQISDHFAQFSIFTDYSLKKEKDNTIRFGRSYKNFRDSEFLEEIMKIDWNIFLESDPNVNNQMDTFLNKITDIINVMAPIRRLTRREVSLQDKPWITRGILKSMHRRDQLYKRYLVEKNDSLKIEIHRNYKKYRNLIVLLLRKSKVLHYRDYFKQHSHNIKKTWDE